MSKKVGAVEWGANQSGSSLDPEKKIPFLEMKEFDKSYKVRVVSDQPFVYHCHWVENKEGKKLKVNCTLDDTCPVIDEKTRSRCAGSYAQTRYYVKVLDRKDGTIKVLDCGSQIFNQIAEFLQNEDWGHPKDFDISIKKGPRGANPLYSLSPSPKKPLTDEEKSLVLNSNDPDHEDFIDLETRCQPLTADVISKLMNGEQLESAQRPRAGRTASSETTTEVVATTTVSTPKASSEEEEDFLDWGDEDNT